MTLSFAKGFVLVDGGENPSIPFDTINIAQKDYLKMVTITRRFLAHRIPMCIPRIVTSYPSQGNYHYDSYRQSLD